jgi:hypothetical protein
MHSTDFQTEILHRSLFARTPKVIASLLTKTSLATTLANSLTKSRTTLTTTIEKSRRTTTTASRTSPATPQVLQFLLWHLLANQQLPPAHSQYGQRPQNRIRLQLRTLTLKLLHNRLQSLLLGILKSTHDGFMKCRNTLLVHCSIGRHRHRLKSLTGCMFNTRKQSPATRMHKQNSFALTPRSPGTPNPMNVCLSASRQIVIDDVADTRHIQASRCHIRGHNDIQMPSSQLLDNPLTLSLHNITMQRGSLVPPTTQVLSQRLSRALQFHKHNRRVDRLCLQNSRQRSFSVLI